VSLIAVGASSDQRRERKARTIGNRHIAVGVLAGVMRTLTGAGAQRSSLLAHLWSELKRYGTRQIPNIELSSIRGIDRVRVNGPVRHHSPMVVTALAILLESETVFEFGPDTGDTAWLLAHNLADARIYQLEEGTVLHDLPHDRTAARATNPVQLLTRGDDPQRAAASAASRIIKLTGESTTFDLRPYSGTADLVYIEGSRRQAGVRADTEAAFGLLSELGAIIWHGYPGDAGLYAYLNGLAASLDRPLVHILGTRLVLYSRWDMVIPDLGP
jgi:hypothetical protein